MSLNSFAYPHRAQFVPESATCVILYEEGGKLNLVMTSVCLGIPFCLIITANLVLWIVAFLSARKLNSQRSKRTPQVPSLVVVNATNSDTKVSSEGPSRHVLGESIFSFIQRKKSCVARRRGLRKRTGLVQRAIFMIGGLSAVLIISWIPMMTKRFGWNFTSAPIYMKRATIYLYFLNTFANPLIYTLVNKEFAEYSKRLLTRWCTCRIRDGSRNVSDAAVHVVASRTSVLVYMIQRHVL